jgi:hypothetical protein
MGFLPCRPVRERRSGDDDGAEQFGADRRRHHHRPEAWVSDHAGLAVGGMQGNDFFEKHRFGTGDVFDGLGALKVA